jgi:hypothetical protein
VCTLASVKTAGDAYLSCASSSTTYTNAFDPAWVDSLETMEQFLSSLPFPNALATSSIFDNSLIHNDPLHVIFRGFAPSFISSAIVIAVKAHAFGRGLLQDNYDNAFESAARFAKEKGYGALSITEFSRSNLGLELGCYPEISCKGADVKTLIFWMESKLQVNSEFSFQKIQTRYSKEIVLERLM